MVIQNPKKTKYACYFAYLAMSSVFCLPPLLFSIFGDTYGISYTLLGTLVLINFFTQLSVDLVFSFFSRHFNIHRTIRVMPLITALGLLIYALVPTFFPQYAYWGLAVGTVIFSVAAGLGEVLVSPTVAALPSDNPDADMSTLHSLYAYGFLGVVVISTLFLKLFGKESWPYLTVFWAVLPVIASIVLHRVSLPDMQLSHNPSKKAGNRTVVIALFVACIFFGSAAENSMSNWISVYMENALGIPKALGDILGMAGFAVLLGLGRTAYAKFGRNIWRTLLLSMLCAASCYLLSVFTDNAWISMAACVLLGLFTSMLWPGTLIMMEETIPAMGVTAYALMAAGGDCGAAFVPQLLGAVIDAVKETPWAWVLAERLCITAEQVGMKAGMLVAALFPITGIFVLLILRRYFKKHPTA